LEFFSMRVCVFRLFVLLCDLGRVAPGTIPTVG
jgi:hypothetical protein